MDEYLIGIDIGTSSCKTIALKTSGEILDFSTNEYEILISKSGWAEQNPEDWYQAFKNGLKNIFERNPEIKRNIVAIGLTGQMAGLVLADKNMDVLLPAIIWMDQRSMGQVDYLCKNFKEDINRITFNPINLSNTLVKIIWIMEHYGDIWKKVHKIQLPKDYIKLKLTNEWNTDYNDASATLLLDVKKLNWSQSIRKIAKIDESKLPELLPCTKIAGFVSKKAADELGIKSGIPVVAGSGDLAAENLAAGILENNQRLTRFGTAGSTSTIIDNPVYDKNEVARCYAYCIPNKWMIETTSQSFGLCKKWYRDTFFSEEHIEAVSDNRNTYELMDEIAGEAPIGSNGLFFHPFNTGEPYWNPNLRGSFYGISLEHNKKHFNRAVLEGCAFGLKDAINCLNSLVGENIKEYTFVGGGSKSKIWVQIICDVLEKDAFVLKTADAALGVAMMAGLGASVFKNFQEAISICLKREIKVNYIGRNVKKYNKLYQMYKEIHRDLMKKSHLLHETNEFINAL